MDIFCRNMEVIGENDPSLIASWADELPDGTDPCVSRSGAPTLLVKGPADQRYFLHSPHDPVKEASALLGDRRFDDGDVTILFGFGLGYLVQEIRKHMDPLHDLIVIEQRPDIFAAAMGLVDLREVLTDPRIRILIAVDSETVIDALKEIRWKALSGKVQKLSYRPAVDLAPGVYKRLENDIEDYVSELKTSLRSFQKRVPLTISNLFHNLPALRRSTPATALNNAFQGLPAVVVTAGPSLDKNIHVIQKARRKAPIIAADAALKPLLASGITPDLIVTLDPIEKNFEKFSGLPVDRMTDIALIFAPEGNRAIPDLFKGPRFFINSQNTFANWLISHIGPVPGFPPMYTVSHLAFFVARHMGCDPIILAGFDLSFPGNRDHARDCAETWTVDFEKRKFIEIEDVHGGKVKTFVQFLYMLRLLEREISSTEALCIDATEGGARIRGTTILSLKEALATYLPQKQTEIVRRLKEIDAFSQSSNTKDLSQGLSWLDSELKHANEIIQSAKSMITTVGLCNGFNGSEERKILSSLAAMKRQIIERTTFFDVLGDLLSDLLIHEIRTARKPRPGLSPETTKVHETLEDYRYFFSELDRILTLLAENSGNAFHPCCPDVSFEKSPPTVTATGSLVPQ